MRTATIAVLVGLLAMSLAGAVTAGQLSGPVTIVYNGPVYYNPVYIYQTPVYYYEPYPVYCPRYPVYGNSWAWPTLPNPLPGKITYFDGTITDPRAWQPIQMVASPGPPYSRPLAAFFGFAEPPPPAVASNITGRPANYPYPYPTR